MEMGVAEDYVSVMKRVKFGYLRKVFDVVMFLFYLFLSTPIRIYILSMYI